MQENESVDRNLETIENVLSPEKFVAKVALEGLFGIFSDLATDPRPERGYEEGYDKVYGMTPVPIPERGYENKGSSDLVVDF